MRAACVYCLLQQAVVKRVEVGEYNRIGFELCTVLGKRGGEIVKRALLVGGGHGTHGLNVWPRKLNATPACPGNEKDDEAATNKAHCR